MLRQHSAADFFCQSPNEIRRAEICLRCPPKNVFFSAASTHQASYRTMASERKNPPIINRVQFHVLEILFFYGLQSKLDYFLDF